MKSRSIEVMVLDIPTTRPEKMAFAAASTYNCTDLLGFSDPKKAGTHTKIRLAPEATQPPGVSSNKWPLIAKRITPSSALSR